MAVGLPWQGLARLSKVNGRIVRHYNASAKPGSGHLANLFHLSAWIGMLHHLLQISGKTEDTAAWQG